LAEKKTPKEQIGVDLPEPEPIPEPVAAAETTEPEPTAEQQRPEWLPEQYKSPEDFAAAHRSLQDKLRQEGESRREERERLAELEAYVQSQQSQTTENDTLQAVADEIAVAREAGDVRRELELQQWLQEYTTRQTLAGLGAERQRADAPMLEAQDELVAAHVTDWMRRQYDDWDEYRQQVAQAIASEPWRLPDEAVGSIQMMQSALGAVYRDLKARDILEQQSELEQRGLSQADLSRARKLEAQTMSGASGRPDEPSKVDREIAEMQHALHGSSWASIRGGR
jgi:hypothetical protein